MPSLVLLQFPAIQEPERQSLNLKLNLFWLVLIGWCPCGLLIFFFNWSTVDMLCCVSFKCYSKVIWRYIHIYVYILFLFFSIASYYDIEYSSLCFIQIFLCHLCMCIFLLSYDLNNRYFISLSNWMRTRKKKKSVDHSLWNLSQACSHTSHWAQTCLSYPAGNLLSLPLSWDVSVKHRDS